MNKFYDLRIETENLVITSFTEDMAESVSKSSLSLANRRFMPDEVFETTEIAREVIADLMECYLGDEGPFVYPILLKNANHIGHVEAVPVEQGWEIGYHVTEEYCGKGYASEAVRAFIPVIMDALDIEVIYGICDAENIASRHVLTKTGFSKVFDGIGMYHGAQCHICRFEYRK